jgi:membrane-associated phospholipid phosphatase
LRFIDQMSCDNGWPVSRVARGRVTRVRKPNGTAFVASALLLVTTGLPCGAQGLDGTAAAPAQGKVTSLRPLGGDFAKDDGRRTLGAFPRNLGRSFVGVFSRESLAPFLVGAAATASASLVDAGAGSMIHGSCEACGRAGATIGGSAVLPVVGAFFVAGRFAPQGRFRSASYDFAQAAIVNGAYTGLFKHSVKRERPDGSDHLSFPSGHTSTAFALATVASHHYGWKAGVPAYVLASGIGLSRIEGNRHHLSDVLAGATLGLIVGRTVTRVNDERPARSSRLAVGPASDLHGAGVGLSLSLSW